MKDALSQELVRERGGTPSRIALLELALADRSGRERPNLGVASRRLGLAGGLAQMVESGLRALAVHQRRELGRWQAEEECRQRERNAQRRKEHDLQFER